MRLLLLTNASGPAADALPSLELLTHPVRVMPIDGSALVNGPPHDLILVDGTLSLPQARATCRLVQATGSSAPLLLVVTEGGLSALQNDWGMDDVILNTAGPAEVEARLRLAVGAARDAARSASEGSTDEITQGELVIDEGAYQARIGKRPLDLTFKEFELLRFLAQHPGRVFTRAQLLQEVWGYDYYGGTRTVDVHVRRLRAKLGLEHDGLVGTVRNVGYRFVPPQNGSPAGPAVAAVAPSDNPEPVER